MVWAGRFPAKDLEVACVAGDAENGWGDGEKVGDSCTRPNGIFPVLIADSQVLFVGYGAESGLLSGLGVPSWARRLAEQ